MGRKIGTGNGPPHPTGTPFRNGLLPEKEADEVLHGAGKIRDYKGSPSKIDIGSMPTGVPSGSMDKITPSKGSP